MSCERLAGLFVDHLVAVAVVSADEQLSVDFLDRLNDSADYLVNSFNSFDCSSFDAGMSDHVAVCEVDYDRVILAASDSTAESIAYFERTHFRLKVICSDLRGRNKNSVFARERFLNAAVEEECYVCIFLCLSCAELLHSELGEIFAEGVCDDLFLERNVLVRDCCIIVREYDELGNDSRASVEACEIIDAECTCHFAGAVRTEVEEDNGIAVFDRSCRSAVFLYYERKNEFIRLAVCIRSSHAFNRTLDLDAFTLGHGIVSEFYTIPVVIAVHCIVAACNCSDCAGTDHSHVSFESFDKALA